MGGIPLPTQDTPGYNLYRGKVACTCLIEWLPVFEQLLLAKRLITSTITILQLTGDYSLSNGIHAGGGVFDIKQYNQATVAVAREMGAPATWMRDMLYADGSPGNTHIHGVLLGCPHTSAAADWQLAEQRAGRDGFANPSPDPHPGPVTYRTYTQGIAWARTQITTLTGGLTMADAQDILNKLAEVDKEATDRYSADTKRYYDLVGRLTSLVTSAAADAGRDAALANAVAQLETSGSVDMAAVQAAAKAGADESLAGFTLHLEPPSA
jgi:hypothetical protein